MFQLTKAEPVSLVKSLLFIPFEISPGIIQPLVRVGWTINYEVLLYVLFAIACRLNHRFRGIICSGFLMLLMLLAHTLPVNSILLHFYGDYILLEFIFGMLLYYVMSKVSVPLSQQKYMVLPAYLCVPAVLVLFGVLAYTKQNVPLIPFGRAIYWGLPALLIVALTFLADTKLTMPKPFVYLGNISFSVFLLHYYPLMFIDRKIYSLEYYTPMAIPVTICGLLVVILLASVSYVLIEKCLARYLRRFFK
jgi:peptidoglycan/LPS O-acetylase OafA/YrhL